MVCSWCQESVASEQSDASFTASSNDRNDSVIPELSNMELLKQVDSYYLNNNISKEIGNDDVLLKSVFLIIENLS